MLLAPMPLLTKPLLTLRRQTHQADSNASGIRSGQNNKVPFEVRLTRQVPVLSPVALILERYYGLIAPAKSGNFHQASVRLGHGHHGSVAIHGMPGRGEVPLPSLSLRRLLSGNKSELGWGRQLGNRKR
jgi:hypothetical protein